MPHVTCPNCSTGMTIKAVPSGKRVRCPKCNQAIFVPPSAADADDAPAASAASPSTNWTLLGASIAISLALGGAAGFVIGHRQGRSDDIRELADARTQAASAQERQKNLETELTRVTVERTTQHDRLTAQLKQTESDLRNSRDAESRAKADAKSAQAKSAPRRDAEPTGKDKAQPAPPEFAGVLNVTAKEIETFGGDMLGQKRQMLCRFREVSDTWVKILLNDDRFVGIYVADESDALFQYAFANKDKYGRELLKKKQNDVIRMLGTIQSVRNTYVFLVTEIRP